MVSSSCTLISITLPTFAFAALGYASLVLHTLTLVWHIVWFTISVTVSLWVEIVPSSRTALLERTIELLSILIAIVCYLPTSLWLI